ncbi:UNVERIFIED_CONTAM: Peptide methionine sulfoxide reductase [Sesamum radiatum]|uniref:peptide-methionine (S)-S-oxide reductase n=1 Tax=Sesamum radiatum TaxID=300843 RepID=A0AAW2KC62_SESRA
MLLKTHRYHHCYTSSVLPLQTLFLSLQTTPPQALQFPPQPHSQTLHSQDELAQQAGIRCPFSQRLPRGFLFLRHCPGPDDDIPAPGQQFAQFGAGCFWGVELAFQRVPGITKTEVGYTQGYCIIPLTRISVRVPPIIRGGRVV